MQNVLNLDYYITPFKLEVFRWRSYPKTKCETLVHSPVNLWYISEHSKFYHSGGPLNYLPTTNCWVCNSFICVFLNGQRDERTYEREKDQVHEISTCMEYEQSGFPGVTAVFKLLVLPTLHRSLPILVRQGRREAVLSR